MMPFLKINLLDYSARHYPSRKHEHVCERKYHVQHLIQKDEHDNLDPLKLRKPRLLQFPNQYLIRLELISHAP